MTEFEFSAQNINSYYGITLFPLLAFSHRILETQTRKGVTLKITLPSIYISSTTPLQNTPLQSYFTLEKL